MQCTNPIFVHRKGYFPCGKCLACRIAKSREWSLRLMDELGYWTKSVFITLTYDDEHIPSDHSLHKDELQRFFKRLRKNYGEKIKYFACGEYGEKVRMFFDINGSGEALGRPHYHAIVFGLGNDTFSKECVKKSWKNCDWNMFQDKKVFGQVTFDSCRYVSDYIFKKYNAEKAQSVYGLRTPPFKIGSNGLGLNFVLNNSDNLSKNGFTSFRGVKVTLPRYYRQKLNIVDSYHDRFSRGQDNLQRWQNYMKHIKLSNADIAYKQKESQEQRKLNYERNAEMHRKGDL